MESRRNEYQSDFARRYFGAGKAEGKAEILVKQLQLKFGELSAEAREHVAQASMDELDCWAERILTAGSLDDVLR